MREIAKFIVLILMSINSHGQEAKSLTIRDLHGIWNNLDSDSQGVYYIFNNEYLLVVNSSLEYDNTIYIDRRVYGFCNQQYKDSIASDTKESSEFVDNYKLKYTQTIEDNYFAIGYFVYGLDFSEDQFTLFGQKVFTYGKIQKLPPNLEKRLREECKKKNIDIDYFLGPSKAKAMGGNR